MIKQRLVTSIFLVLLGTLAGVTVAQEAPLSVPHLERLEIAIWPEYDQPSVLVMLRGWLAQDTTLPTSIPLPMPVAAGSPSAVAKRFPGGQLLVAQYLLESGEELHTVYVSTDSPEIRLEYYVPLDLDGEQRHHLFKWPGGLNIDRVLFEVQQPIGATNFAVQPASAAPTLGNDGLIYQREDLGAAAADHSFTIAVDYIKTSPTLTAQAVQPPPPQSQAAQTPSALPAPPGAFEPQTGPPPPAGVSPWLVPGLIVIGVGLLLVFMALKGKKTT